MESSQPTQPLPNLPWKDKIAYLAWKISQNGGVKPEDIPVKHTFELGRYIREFNLPADFLFIGRVHRKGHIVLLCEGTARLITPQGSILYTGPDAILTIPGFQTVAHILTPCKVRSIHPNPLELREIEELEDLFFEPVQPVLAHGQAIQERLWLV